MIRAFSKITLVIGAYEERIVESLGFSHRHSGQSRVSQWGEHQSAVGKKDAGRVIAGCSPKKLGRKEHHEKG